jgi:hypothetical protein
MGGVIDSVQRDWIQGLQLVYAANISSFTQNRASNLDNVKQVRLGFQMFTLCRGNCQGRFLSLSKNQARHFQKLLFKYTGLL